MTEVFYVAVKGSLHAGDSSVFGIKTEEYSALCRRFPDSNKQVINGVLIKGSPLEVINSLAELGYRVTCSSGETEIVWTLRREALPGEKLVSPVTSPQATPPLQVVGRPFVVQPSMTRAPVKTVERIGTKPEDWQELNSDLIQEPDKITTRHISSLERIDPGQKIILKTNLSSEFNPLSKRPGPVQPADHRRYRDRSLRPRRRSLSVPPLSRSSLLLCKHVHPKSLHQNYEDDDWAYKPINYNCYHVQGANVILRKREKTAVRREGLKIFLEDICSSDGETRTKKRAFIKNRRDIVKSLFMPLEDGSKKFKDNSNKRESVSFFKKEMGDFHMPSNMCHLPLLSFATSNTSFHKSAANKQSIYSEPISHCTSICPTFPVGNELGSSVARTFLQPQVARIRDELSKSDISSSELLPIIPSGVSDDSKSEQQANVLSGIEHSVEIISDSCGLLMKTKRSGKLGDTHSVCSKGSPTKSFSFCSDNRYSTRTETMRNESKEMACSNRGISTNLEASYPDTLSDPSELNSDKTYLLRSDAPSHRNSYSSRTICPHGFILSDLPFTEKTYQVHAAPTRNAIQSPTTTSERKPSRCCQSSDNSRGIPSESTKQIRRCSPSAASNLSQPPSTFGVLQQVMTRKGESEKLEDLDEADWTVISNLVDELFSNKRKRRRRMSLTEDANPRS